MHQWQHMARILGLNSPPSAGLPAAAVNRVLTELEIDDINNSLQSADYEELMKLTAKLERKNEYRDILYSEWEELSERLTELEE